MGNEKGTPPGRFRRHRDRPFLQAFGRLLLAVPLLAGASRGFDGEMGGFVIGAEAGIFEPALKGEGGIPGNGNPSREKGAGYSWGVDAGYSWSRFGLSANYSRRRFDASMWKQSAAGEPFIPKLETVVGFPALGFQVPFRTRQFGKARHLRIAGEMGAMLIDEQGIFKTMGPGISFGIGYEILKYAFLEAKWAGGGSLGNGRKAEVSFLQAALRFSLY